MEEKILYSLEAERSLLGCFLLEETSLKEVLDYIGVNDFYDKDHQETYRAILAVKQREENVDMVTVGGELQKRGLLDVLGGAVFLAELQNEVPVATHVKHYAQIVKHNSMLRRMKRGLERSLMCIDPTLNYQDIRTRVANNVLLEEKMVERSYDFHSVYNQWVIESEKEAIKTGFGVLDNAFGGMKIGKVIVLAAESGVGKTTLLCQIIHNLLSQKIKMDFYSLEMRDWEIFNIFNRIRAGVEDQMYASELHIFDSRHFKQIDDLMYQMKIRRPQIAFIDYLLIIRVSENQGHIYQRVVEVCDKLQEITRTQDTTIFILSQVSNDTKRSGFTQEGKGGGEIKQMADIFFSILAKKEDEAIEQKAYHDGKAGGMSGFESHVFNRQIYLAKNRGGRDNMFLDIKYDFLTGLYLY